MKKTILKSVINVVFFFLINFGLWEVLVATGMNRSWASFTVYAVLIAVVIAIWNKELLSKWDQFKKEIKSWRIFFIELLIWLAAASVLAYLFQYIVNGSFKTQNTETVGAMADTIPPILTCIMMSIFTPFIEELTFRESLIGWVNKRNKAVITIMAIISIIVFDCIHLYELREFFYYLPLSIGLTTFYIKNNRNIYSSIIMHALANLPGAVMIIIGVM